jgi:hypothetical protein
MNPQIIVPLFLIDFTVVVSAQHITFPSPVAVLLNPYSDCNSNRYPVSLETKIATPVLMSTKIRQIIDKDVFCLTLNKRKSSSF